MSLQEIVVNAFRENFIYKNKSVTVIYGLGKMTMDILEAYPDYPVIGLLDGNLTEGEMYGKPIIELESLAGKEVKIVIVARKASEQIIYRRIKKFCSDNKIIVYSLDGNRLDLQQKTIINHPYFELDEVDILANIRSHDVISFDIFDTLIMRTVNDVQTRYNLFADIYELGEEFAKRRMVSEQQLSCKDGCPSLNAIYHNMGYDDDICRRMVELEYEFEKRIIVSRPGMMEVYQAAVQSGKPVYFVSDMFFDKEKIIGILTKCGIVGYQDIFISSVQGSCKTNNLYGIYKDVVENELKVERNISWLHIGDSEESDVFAAKRHGIDTILVKTVSQMADLSVLSDLFNDMDKTPILRELIQSDIFANPFDLKKSNGRIFLKKDYSIKIAALLMPIILGFVSWLKRVANNIEADKIIFIARDGYLFKKVYEKLIIPGPNAVYLYTSRTALSDIVSSSEKTGCYLKYLKKINISDDILVDFTATGTCQMLLENITGNHFKGLYFKRILNDEINKENLLIEDYIGDDNAKNENVNYFVLETLIKEPVNSMQGIDTDGNRNFCSFGAGNEEYKKIAEIQETVIKNVEKYLKLLGGIPECDIESVGKKWYMAFSEEYVSFEGLNLRNYDTFTKRVIEI